MRGESSILHAPFCVRFPFEYRYKPGRTFLLRARIEPDPAGGFRVVWPGEQDSSFLSSFAVASAIITLPADQDVVREGEARPAVWIRGR